MMKYQKILVDVSNIYHRAYNTSSKLTTKLEDGTELVTGGIYTSLRMIQKIEREYLASTGEMFLLFDNHTSKDDLRKDIDPDYKANRKKQKEPGFYRGLDFLALILNSYSDNFAVVKKPNVEADDLVGPLIEDSNAEERVLLVSNDMDWARSIGGNVYWMRNDTVYDEETFAERYGFKPTGNSVTLYKAFRGDDSDNIPKGVPNIREKVLIRLVTDFNSLNEIFHSLGEISYLGETWQKRIEENKARLRLNYKLVDFIPISINELEDYIFPCEYQPNQLRMLYNTLGFNISKLDPRVLEDITTENDNNSGQHELDVFSFDKANRA